MNHSVMPFYIINNLFIIADIYYSKVSHVPELDL